MKLQCERSIVVMRRVQACPDPAARYRVVGKSLTCESTLCWKHRNQAERQGFTLISIATERVIEAAKRKTS